MTFTSDCPQGRSQFLSFAESSDKIVIDRKTFEELRSVVISCVDELANPQNSEIFLESLKLYLSKSDNPDPSKSLMLLDVYCDVVPEALLQVTDWLEEAREIFNVILAASKLGGDNG